MIVRADARRLPLPDGSVDLVVTSPPYYALRSYADGGQHYAGQIGDEATPAEYVDNLVACTREWVRVLKPSGSIWVNLGDSYAGKPSSDGSGRRDKAGTRGERPDRRRDREMTREEAAWLAGVIDSDGSVSIHLGVDHFAAFPMEWPRRIILGWSPSGVCTGCGEGRRPVVDKPNPVGAVPLSIRDDEATGVKRFGATSQMRLSGGPRQRWKERNPDTLVGEQCGCPDTTAPTRPAVVLDPFGGTGTTALVAETLGRVGISVDRSADYCRLARWRTTDPGQRAAAMQVPKPPRQVDGQDDLLGLLGET